MTTASALLTIGEVARRAGVSVATLRYYEQRGLVVSTRTGGNQRRYPRWVLRKLAFVAAAQHIRLCLDQVKEALDTLPAGRAPTQQDAVRPVQRERRSRGRGRGLPLAPPSHPTRLTVDSRPTRAPRPEP